MYFSLITAADGQVHEALHQHLGGPYSDHQWLWRWFPAEAGTARDFLFRRQDADDGPPRFYVVSQRPPMERLGAWIARTRDYAPRLEVGEQLRFELRANPTVRHGRDGKSKRHDVVMEAKTRLLTQHGLTRWQDWQSDDKPALHAVIQRACSDWLARRGELAGFSLDVETLIVESHQQHREKREASLMFTTVDLQGQLTVTDPQRFQQMLTKGIGHAKAFGCGLMLVRRPG